MSTLTRRLKVILADDESIIREGIAQSINWNEMGLELVAEAEDGEEALALALEHQVDLMLVDLSMPIMNGLELIKQLKINIPACKVSIITGHDEFTYAKEAIKLGVEDYILKPVDPQYLSDVLAAMIKKIEDEHYHKKLIEQASTQIDKNISVLRERFGQEWVKGNLEDNELYEQLQFLQLPFSTPQGIALMTWNTDHQLQINTERDKHLIRYAIENIVCECLDELELSYFLFKDEFNDFVIITNTTIEQHVFTKIFELVKKYLKMNIEYSSVHLYNGANSVHQGYIEAKNEVYRSRQLTPLIKQAKQLINQKYWESSLSLERLAFQLNVTSVYLSRLFKQELGLTFVQYITYVRMKQAMQLLTQTSLSINEIAEHIGYESQHYFSTAFRKAMGMSPNQFRKQAL